MSVDVPGGNGKVTLSFQGPVNGTIKLTIDAAVYALYGEDSGLTFRVGDSENEVIIVGSVFRGRRVSEVLDKE